MDESFPNEINEKILFMLSVPEIINYCKSSPSASKLCRDRNFWIGKLNYDFQSNGVFPSNFVCDTDLDGFLIYKRFANGIRLGIDIMLRRGYPEIADWLWERNQDTDINIDIIIYNDMIQNSQWEEIEVCISHKLYPHDVVVTNAILNNNVEFIKIMLDYGLLQQKYIRNYMSHTQWNSNISDTTMINIKAFEFMIKNNILPTSYEHIILYPEYTQIMRKYGIEPFKQHINFINEFYNHPHILRHVLEIGLFPDTQSISDMRIKDKSQYPLIIKILLEFKVSNPSYLVNLSVQHDDMDILIWWMNQGIYPNIHVRIIQGYPRYYLMFEYLLQHNIYPDLKIINDAFSYPDTPAAIILSEYGIYPSN